MLLLQEKHCKPCEGGTPPFNEEDIQHFRKEISRSWEVKDNKRLVGKFPFEDFKRGMAFAQEIGLIAEKENHHPDLCVHYDNVVVELSTHAIGGLSENDFIMAAKIDEL